MIAAIAPPITNAQILKYPLEASSPAVNSKLSHGKKKPISKPDSANSIRKVPSRPMLMIVFSSPPPNRSISIAFQNIEHIHSGSGVDRTHDTRVKSPLFYH